MIYGIAAVALFAGYLNMVWVSAQTVASAIAHPSIEETHLMYR